MLPRQHSVGVNSVGVLPFASRALTNHPSLAIALLGCAVPAPSVAQWTPIPRGG